MAKLTRARRVAAKALGDVRRRDGFGREILRHSGAMASLGARERAQATRLVLGAVACRGFLDEVIKDVVRRPSSLQPKVKDGLMVAIYELLFLSTPSEVAVDQGVGLVRAVAPRAAGLANAALHRVVERWVPRCRKARKDLGRLVRGKAHLGDGETVQAMAWGAGLPRWLSIALVADLGTVAAASMALALLDPPAPYGTLLGVDPKEAHGLLEAEGYEPVATYLRGTYELDRGHGSKTSEAVAAGTLLVSDLHAQTVAMLAAPAPGTTMLEIGAGKGNKTLRMAQTLKAADATAAITVSDLHGDKLAAIGPRLEGAGLSHAMDLTLEEGDGRELDGTLGPFDTVFLDAPCSGVGTLGRHPEIIWSLDPASLAPEDPAGLVALQRALLEKAASLVAPGGRLVYSTCSVFRREGIDQVRTFLASPQGHGFSPMALEEQPWAADIEWDGLEGEDPELRRAEGSIQWIPVPGSADGHFVAVLQRA